MRSVLFISLLLHAVTLVLYYYSVVPFATQGLSFKGLTTSSKSSSKGCKSGLNVSCQGCQGGLESGQSSCEGGGRSHSHPCKKAAFVFFFIHWNLKTVERQELINTYFENYTFIWKWFNVKSLDLYIQRWRRRPQEQPEQRPKTKCSFSNTWWRILQWITVPFHDFYLPFYTYGQVLLLTSNVSRLKAIKKLDEWIE